MISPLRSTADVKPENALVWYDGGPQYDVPLSGNRLVDGDMENSATTMWTAAGGATLTKQTSGQHSRSRCLRVTGNIGALCHQPVVVVGATYRFRGWVRSQDGLAVPYMFNWSTFLWYGTASTAWQYAEFTFTATGGASFGIYIAGANGAVEADDWELELISIAQDSDFELADLSKWSAGNSAVLSKTTTTPYAGTRCLRVTYGGTLKPYAYQSVTTALPYRVTGRARGDGTFAPKFMNGLGQELWTGTAATDWQALDISFVQGGTLVGFMSAASSAGYADFDDLICLRTNEIADGDMELADTTKWTANNGAALSKQTASPHAGTRNLRVAYNGVANPWASQLGLVDGFTYTISAWGRGDGAFAARIGFVGLNSVQVRADSTNANTWQLLTATGACGGAATGVYLQALAPSAGYAEFDDVQLALVKTTQDEDFELADLSKWVIGGGAAVVSKPTTSPHSGTRCLRVGYGNAALTAIYQSKAREGSTFTIAGAARGDGTANPSITFGATTAWTGTTSTGWQVFSVQGIGDSTSAVFLTANNLSAGKYVDFDSLVLTRTNELADGDMEIADTTKWAAVTSTISKQTGTPHAGTRCLRIAYNNNANGWAYQSVLVTGFTYRHVGWARGDGSAAPAIADTIVRWNGTNSASWQAFDVTYTNGNASLQLGSTSLSAAHYVEFDDVTTALVKTTQDEDMEAADAALWTAANATLSKVADGTQHGGTRFLRVTRSAGTGFYATQNSLYGGWTMRVQVWARGDGTRSPTVYAGTQLVWAGSLSTGWQQCDVTVTVPGATGAIALKLGCEGSAGYVDFDDLTVTLVNLLADGDAELMDLSKWTASNALLAKTTTTSHGGTHALRVMGYGIAQYYATQNCLYGGWTMRVQVWARGDGAVAPTVYAGTQLIWTGSVLAAWQQCDVTLAVPGAAGVIALKLGSEAASGAVDFDDLQVDLISLLIDGDAERMDLSKWTASLAITRKIMPGYEGTHCLEVVKVATNAYVTPVTAPTVGSKYIIAGWAKGDGNTAPQLFDGVQLLWAGTSSTSWQFFRVTFTCTGILAFYPVGQIAGKIYIDDIRLLPMVRVADNLGRAPGAPKQLLMGDGITAATIPSQITGKHGIAMTGTQYVDTRIVDRFERTDMHTLFMATKSNSPYGICTLGSVKWIGADRGGFGFAYEVGNSVFYELYASAAKRLRAGVVFSSLGVHTHCATYDGSSLGAGMKCYNDGSFAAWTPVATGTLDATIKNANSIKIGGFLIDGVMSQMFKGTLHNVFIFPWELTPQQIQHLHRYCMTNINAA